MRKKKARPNNGWKTKLSRRWLESIDWDQLRSEEFRIWCIQAAFLGRMPLMGLKGLGGLLALRAEYLKVRAPIPAEPPLPYPEVNYGVTTHSFGRGYAKRGRPQGIYLEEY